MFKISIFDGDGHAALIKQAGFDSVMIGWRDADRKEKLLKARNAGLYIENIHAVAKNAESIWSDNLDGKYYMKCLINSIDDCREYNIPTMVVHLNNGSMPPLLNNIGIERLKRIAEKAEQENINVALENTCATDCIRYVFDNVSSKKFGFCYDSGHHNLYAPDRDLLEEYGDRLMAMHLNDNFGVDDLHLMPFDGNIDWKKVTQQFKSIRYNGTIALEISKHGIYKDWLPEKFFEVAFDRAKAILDMMNEGVSP